MYGEVTTPYLLIDELFDMLDDEVYNNTSMKWLDPCAGSGVFFERLFSTRIISLPFPNNKNFWVSEINGTHIELLRHKFGDTVCVNHVNFLEFDQSNFDIIVANPPFQVNGSIKVPTKKGEKKKDGREMWSKFVKHSMELLKPGGILLCITPVIWLKRDHNMHDFIMQYTIKQMKCYSAGEANKLFKGNCQSPVVLFKLIKEHPQNDIQTVKMGEILYSFHINESIPMKHYKNISKMREYVKKVGGLRVIKTSMRPGRPKNLYVNKEKKGEFVYKNIKTCVTTKTETNNISPLLVIEYSNIPCVFYNVQKLVLAHKMNGYCYFDKKGEYGISNRDNYVLVDYTEKEMEILNTFLNLDCIIQLFDATRYRMRYLERYIFDFIPNITLLPDFPEEITEKSVKSYFKFTDSLNIS